MPDGSSGLGKWRRLGRLLPPDVREHVFEPALADLAYDRLTHEESSRLPFGLRAVGTCLGCMPLAARRLFVRRGRLTRFGQVSMWSLTVLTVLVLALVRLRQTYGY